MNNKNPRLFCILNSLFKFGDSFILKALKRVQLPIIIANVEVILTTDIIDRDTPLLLSKASMQKEDIQINFKQDRVTMFVNDVPLEIDSSAHYLTIKPCKLTHKDLEIILIRDIINKNYSSKKKNATKLRR